MAATVCRNHPTDLQTVPGALHKRWRSPSFHAFHEVRPHLASPGSLFRGFPRFYESTGRSDRVWRRNPRAAPTEHRTSIREAPLGASRRQSPIGISSREHPDWSGRVPGRVRSDRAVRIEPMRHRFWLGKRRMCEFPVFREPFPGPRESLQNDRRSEHLGRHARFRVSRWPERARALGPRRRERVGRIASRCLRVKVSSAEFRNGQSTRQKTRRFREPCEPAVRMDQQEPLFGGFSVRSHGAARSPAPRGG